jgi:hypothetical protein
MQGVKSGGRAKGKDDRQRNDARAGKQRHGRDVPRFCRDLKQTKAAASKTASRSRGEDREPGSSLAAALRENLRQHGTGSVPVTLALMPDAAD